MVAESEALKVQHRVQCGDEMADHFWRRPRPWRPRARCTRALHRAIIAPVLPPLEPAGVRLGHGFAGLYSKASDEGRGLPAVDEVVQF